jgi:hypothetical protein
MAKPFTVSGDEWNTRVDLDWNAQAVIRRVTPPKCSNEEFTNKIDCIDNDGTWQSDKQSLTSDTAYVRSFLVMDDGTVVYEFDDRNQNDSGIKMITGTSTNRLTNANNSWSEFFYTVDDANTVIFGQSNSDWYSQNSNDGIRFAQKHPTVEGAKLSQVLNTKLFSDTATPTRIITADDGSLYGMFIEESWSENGPVSTVSLYRVLPFSNAPRLQRTFNMGYWEVVESPFVMNMQIAKGFAYFLEKDSHPQGWFSDRTIISAIKLVDGSKVSLLSDAEWSQRFEVYNWKLSSDVIYFTGMDNSKSMMISGQIDVIALKRGAPEEEYLSIKEAGSILGESAQINDMEMLKGRAVNVFTGGNPRILNFFSDPENVFSASVEFSKYMDQGSVGESLSFTYNEKVEDGDPIPHNVTTMNVWLGRTVHLILDIDDSNATTDPIPFGTKFTIDVAGSALDLEGFSLDMADDPILSYDFSTRIENGWYQGETGRIAYLSDPDDELSPLVVMTDGIVGKFVAEPDMFNGKNHINLLDNVNSPNFELSFVSKRTRSPDQESGLEILLRDAKRVDWSNVEGGLIDENGNEWRQTESKRVDADGNEWEDHRDPNSEPTWVKVTKDAEGNEVRISYLWQEGYHISEDGRRFIRDRRFETDYLIDLDSGMEWEQDPEYYIDSSERRFYWKFGDYKAEDGTLLDDVRQEEQLCHEANYELQRTKLVFGEYSNSWSCDTYRDWNNPEGPNLCKRIDTNTDGAINCAEFAAKYPADDNGDIVFESPEHERFFNEVGGDYFQSCVINTPEVDYVGEPLPAPQECISVEYVEWGYINDEGAREQIFTEWVSGFWYAENEPEVPVSDQQWGSPVPLEWQDSYFYNFTDPNDPTTYTEQQQGWEWNSIFTADDFVDNSNYRDWQSRRLQVNVNDWNWGGGDVSLNYMGVDEFCPDCLMDQWLNAGEQVYNEAMPSNTWAKHVVRYDGTTFNYTVVKPSGETYAVFDLPYQIPAIREASGVYDLEMFIAGTRHEFDNFKLVLLDAEGNAVTGCVDGVSETEEACKEAGSKWSPSIDETFSEEPFDTKLTTMDKDNQG